MPRFTTVLHPTDFSEDSRAAAELAGSLVSGPNSRLILLHVAQVPPGPVYAAWAPATAAHASLPEGLEQELERYPVETDPDTRIERIVELGEPKDTIVRVARDRKVDLIVLGSKGRSGLGRLFLGSVAEGVTRAADCPVLIVKARRAPHEEAGAQSGTEDRPEMEDALRRSLRVPHD